MSARLESRGMGGSDAEEGTPEPLCREHHSAGAEHASEGGANDASRLSSRPCATVLTPGQLAPLAKMIAWDLVHADDRKG